MVYGDASGAGQVEDVPTIMGGEIDVLHDVEAFK